jgi:hypothetical protein
LIVKTIKFNSHYLSVALMLLFAAFIILNVSHQTEFCGEERNSPVGWVLCCDKSVECLSGRLFSMTNLDQSCRQRSPAFLLSSFSCLSLAAAYFTFYSILIEFFCYDVPGRWPLPSIPSQPDRKCRAAGRASTSRHCPIGHSDLRARGGE